MVHSIMTCIVFLTPGCPANLCECVSLRTSKIKFCGMYNLEHLFTECTFLYKTRLIHSKPGYKFSSHNGSLTIY